MTPKFALIGPSKKVAYMARSFFKNKREWEQLGRLVSVTTTDGQSIELDIPHYFDWQDMLAQHQIDSIINLDHDPALKQELRRNLPSDVDLSENIPGQLLHTLFLAKSVHKQKALDKNIFLEQVVHALPFAIIVYDRQGRVIYWNEHCEQMTGVKAKDVLGKKKVGIIFYPYHRPLVGQLILESLDPDVIRQIFNEQDTNIKSFPNGIQVSGFIPLRSRIQGYYQITAMRIVRNDKVLGAFQLIHDVNSLVLLKNQLRNQQEIMQNILLRLPFPLIHTNLKGDIFFTNKAAENDFIPFTGNEKAENVFDLIPEAKNQISEHLSTLQKDVLTRDLAQKFTLDLNSKQWDVTCIIIPDEQNKNSGLIWILRNISAEETRDRLNAALAMSGAISHELAQPLTAIVNSAQLLARTEATDVERIRRHQKIITTESERVFKIYRKLQNITQFKVQKYLDTQILDLEESSDDLSSFETKQIE
ncbi:PAS domain-containing protein [Desulfohalobiaceae bacterium Ax17]|uniref:PAS domain-containing protein n=1 Tax=Desulfovulcanus ferrireducens TaxID=2831190 RepID=UPI00207BB0F3|nr:PAS domain-containing protein [Desulfovulcanus ferrireducens]MBT8763700.1 PAS domain-containing protein [Desulfovulcanus ferrireducens]